MYHTNFGIYTFFFTCSICTAAVRTLPRVIGKMEKQSIASQKNNRAPNTPVRAELVVTRPKVPPALRRALKRITYCCSSGASSSSKCGGGSGARKREQSRFPRATAAAAAAAAVLAEEMPWFAGDYFRQ